MVIINPYRRSDSLPFLLFLLFLVNALLWCQAFYQVPTPNPPRVGKGGGTESSLGAKKGGGGGASKTSIRRVCATNKFAGSNYELGKKYEAGVVLVGTEVGPLIGGACQLKDAYCRVKRGELWIYNLFIGKHKTTGKYFNHEEKRPRKLLMHEAEIAELKDKSEKEGFTLVPTRLYLNDRYRVKLELAIGKGKKKYDKRESIRARELKRSFDRILKSF